jgi:hypothetical protein
MMAKLPRSSFVKAETPIMLQDILVRALMTWHEMEADAAGEAPTIVQVALPQSVPSLT